MSNNLTPPPDPKDLKAPEDLKAHKDGRGLRLGFPDQ